MEMREVLLCGVPVRYVLNRSRRARRLRMSISPLRGLLVSAPLRSSSASVDRFVFMERAWVMKYHAVFAHAGERREARVCLYAERKEEALRIIEAYVDRYNAPYRLDFRGVYVRNQETRWGSCSASGALTFNFLVAFLPERLASYVVVHELCHLRVMNHGPTFWLLVSKTIPDYAERRLELRAYRHH